MTDALGAAIHHHYDVLPAETPRGWRGPIHPFIGSAFVHGDAALLRVMAIGVNAYCAVAERPSPNARAQGFRDQAWGFERRVLKDLEAVADGLVGSAVVGARRFAGIESIYLTNAVKRWIPDGQRAAAVDDALFHEGESVFRAELATLGAEERRLLGLDKLLRVGRLADGHRRYLLWHRERRRGR